MLHVPARCSPHVEAALMRLVPVHERLATAYPGLPGDATFYSALFARGEPPRLAPDLGALLSAVCDELLAISYGATPAHVLTAGFIESPVRCRAQKWHFDYRGRTENLFVPLVPQTERNGTEYVAWATPEAGPAMLERYCALFSDTEQLDLSSLAGTDAHRVLRATARPFEILRMPHHLLHRGVENREPYVRRVFYMATKNDVPVDALYDRDVAHRQTLRNLLQREGYESLEAVKAEGLGAGRLVEARSALRRVLVRRKLELSVEDSARIDTSTDLAALERWHDQAIDAVSAAEALR
jgi:hypothetical protein